MKISEFVQKSPVVGIMTTQLKLAAFLEKKFRAIEVSYLEAMVLAALFFEDKGKVIGPSQIARSILYPPPRVSSALSSLQEKGFLTREFVESDCRKTRLQLTVAGNKQAARVVGVFNSIEEEIGKVISVSYGTQLNKNLLRLRADVFT